MSDSADICVRESGREVYLYTHSSGTDLPHLVRAGLLTAVQKKRTEDAPYLTRILFCHMLTPEELYEALYYGIWTQPSGDRLITIDVDNQTVESDDYAIPRQSINDFIHSTYEGEDDDEEDPDEE